MMLNIGGQRWRFSSWLKTMKQPEKWHWSNMASKERLYEVWMLYCTKVRTQYFWENSWNMCRNLVGILSGFNIILWKRVLVMLQETVQCMEEIGLLLPWRWMDDSSGDGTPWVSCWLDFIHLAIKLTHILASNQNAPTEPLLTWALAQSHRNPSQKHTLCMNYLPCKRKVYKFKIVTRIF